MVTGTYYIRHVFDGTPGTCEFKVRGYTVIGKGASLDKAVYDPIDTIRLSMLFEANQAISCTLTVYAVSLRGERTDLLTMPVSLTEGLNTVNAEGTLQGVAGGMYRLIYVLTETAHDLKLTSGGEAFDVREAAILSLSPDNDSFAETEHVLLTARIYVAKDFYGEIRWMVDGNAPAVMPVDFTGDTTRSLDAGVLDFGEHTIVAELHDFKGMVSTKSAQVTVANTLPPAKPAALAATVEWKTVWLDWSPNAEPDLEGYNVYRDDVLLNETPLLWSDYADPVPDAGCAYLYHVTAVDNAGNESLPSDEVTAVVDTEPPVITLDPSGFVTA